MVNTYTNHWLKTILLLCTFVILMVSFSGMAIALDDRDSAIEEYKQGLLSAGFTGDAQVTAEEAVDAVIDSMGNSQSAIQEKFNELEERIDSMHMKDTRKDDAKEALSRSEAAVDFFLGSAPNRALSVIVQIGGVAPVVRPDPIFSTWEESASRALTDVNKVLIAPSRPGVIKGDDASGVPEGDILEDFIPQLVRQLFRFAWLVILISFIVSGVFLIIAFDNEERISGAKRMIYFTLLGFAFVSLAFALVKAITDIDFFGFI